MNARVCRAEHASLRGRRLEDARAKNISRKFVTTRRAPRLISRRNLSGLISQPSREDAKRSSAARGRQRAGTRRLRHGITSEALLDQQASYTITPCSLHAPSTLSTVDMRRSGDSATGLSQGRNSGAGGLAAGSFDWLAGGAGYAAGTMAVVCAGESSQPSICCRVRMKIRWPAGGTPNRST